MEVLGHVQSKKEENALYACLGQDNILFQEPACLQHRGGFNWIVSEGIYGMQSLFLPGSGLHVQQWSRHGAVSPPQKLALQTTAMKISY